MIDLKFKLPTDAELMQLLDMAPKLKKFEVADKAVRAAGQVVLKRVKQLTPRGTAANEAKRGSKQRDAANWDNTPLWKGMAMVVRKYDTNAVTVVGPKWPGGNKIYLVAEWKQKTRRQMYWGTPGKQYTRRGRTYTAPPGKVVQKMRNFIVQAFDETKAAQLEAMKASLKVTLDQVMRG